MSVNVMSMVWDSTVPAPERFTLLALADRADEDGRCWPSIPRLAQKCRTGESTVRRHLTALRSLGVITIEQRWNNSSVYTINLPKLRDLVDNEDPSQSDTPSQSDRGSQPDRGAQSDTPLQIERTPSQSERLSIKETPTTPTSSEPEPPPAKPKRRRSTADEPPREEVKALCAHLRDLVVANGSKEPSRSAKNSWLTAARRLLDVDKRPLAEAHALIDWCQNDSFWMANVRCMESFRRQYDALRLRAQGENGGRHLASVQPPRKLEIFEDYRQHAAGIEAARLLGIGYVPRPQPPRDDTPAQQWAATVAIEWIDAHEAQLRAALAERKPA